MHLDTRESQEIDIQQSTVKQLLKRYYGEFQEHDEVVETKEREEHNETATNTTQQ